MGKYVILLVLISYLANSQNIQSKKSEGVFIENKGQWPVEVKFMTKINGLNAWITEFGVVYDFFNIERQSKTGNPLQFRERVQADSGRIKGHVIKMSFEGCQKASETIVDSNSKEVYLIEENDSAYFDGSGKQETYYNYFIGNDSTKWASFVGLYNEAYVKNIYKGIDIRYYFEENEQGRSSLRYDFIVRPGAEVSNIRMVFDGADSIDVDEHGNLVFFTSIGEIQHSKLRAFELDEVNNLGRSGNNEFIKYDINNVRKIDERDCRFSRITGNIFGLLIPEYDKSKPLIIDPLVWSSFIGGSAGDGAWSLTTDANDNSFILGYSASTNFPTTTGAYDQSYNGGQDATVTKINSSGSSLSFSTFIGGSSLEEALSITTDNSGNIYICGHSLSIDYPTTNGVYDISNDGSWDVIVTKLNSSGSTLVYSTYIGVSNSDLSTSLAIASNGNICIGGYTESSSYPATTGAYDQSFNGGQNDATVAVLNSTFSSLIFSTFIGGSGEDSGHCLSIDSDNNLFLTGATKSSNFPTTIGVFDNSYNGDRDYFATKLNSSGASLDYSTFLGASSEDYVISSIIDNSNNFFMTGFSFSISFPTSAGAYDVSYNGGSGDVVVTKLNSTASSVDYSTFIGGSGGENGRSIYLDSDNNIIVSGYTNSSNYPVTSSPIQNSNAGGNDCFVTKFDPAMSNLIYSTYFGGTNNDNLHCAKSCASSGIIISGETSSSDFPITIDSYQTLFGGTSDIFVSKLELSSGPPKIQSVTSKDLLDITCNYSRLDTIWVKSTGTGNLIISSSSFSGTNATEFQRIAPTSWPQTVKAGDSIRVVIRFTPSSVGLKIAKLSLTNNSETNPWDINISGRKDSVGFAMNNLSGDTLVIDFGIVCPNSAKDTSLTIKNTSTIPTTLYFGGVNSPFTIQSVSGTKKEDDDDAVLRKEKK